ncbi:MAG: Cobyrinic acid ac-diamide synthase [Bacilli bacterium]|nr:Cobyrinic acid ac-diamide synthase [Bacilli bacterium]
MSITISCGVQKGGCSKTTTAGILIHQLINDGNKVLAIDMDCQGNLTEFLTLKPCSDFEKKTVLEAINEKDPDKYIFKVNESLDLLAADNLLTMLPRQLYQLHGFNNPAIYTELEGILKGIKERYDYIIIDTPPALSEHTINALVASDYVLVMYESSQWCYSAIPNFLGSVELAKNFNSNLKILGILRTLNDARRYDSKAFNEMIEEEYPELVFNTVIKRKAATGRLPINGFHGNEELIEATNQFIPFYKELLSRVKK